MSPPIILAPDEKREYDMADSDACDEWRNGDRTTADPVAWASPFWRLRTDYERVAPWVVSELVLYSDRACSADASLAPTIDGGYAGSRGGALSSAWAGAGRAYTGMYINSQSTAMSGCDS